MNNHFRRLEKLYGRSHAASTQATVSFGRAVLHGDMGDELPGTTAAEQLLTDAARLAAGSLQKEHVVSAEQFEIDVKRPDYSGPIQAMAQVILTEPPRAVVTSLLLDADNDIIAEARGTFAPTKEQLPDLSAVANGSSEEHPAEPPSDAPFEDGDSGLKPASFMPVFSSPFGVVCLN
ncbi:MAG: hypothetical protein PPP56_03305 [Longimonas sp.]|uniref:hypothetical protein n=1 Tax=Longimonas sp. TaxID=2039626 RepID=UPI00334B52A9